MHILASFPHENIMQVVVVGPNFSTRYVEDVTGMLPSQIAQLLYNKAMRYPGRILVMVQDVAVKEGLAYQLGEDMQSVRAVDLPDNVRESMGKDWNMDRLRALLPAFPR